MTRTSVMPAMEYVPRKPPTGHKYRQNTLRRKMRDRERLVSRIIRNRKAVAMGRVIRMMPKEIRTRKRKF